MSESYCQKPVLKLYVFYDYLEYGPMNLMVTSNTEILVDIQHH